MSLEEETNQIREEQIHPRELMEEILKQLTNLAIRFEQIANEQNFLKGKDQESAEFEDKVKYAKKKEELGELRDKLEDEEEMEEELLETAPAEGINEEKEDFKFIFSIDSDLSSLSDTTADKLICKDQICFISMVFNCHFIGGGPKEEENLAGEKLGKRLKLKSSSLSMISWMKDFEQFSKSSSTLALQKWKLRDMG